MIDEVTEGSLGDHEDGMGSKNTSSRRNNLLDLLLPPI